jgi:hypothetical protein
MTQNKGLLCPTCKTAISGYFDEVGGHDLRLRFIADMCMAAHDKIEAVESIDELGAMIREYIERRRLLEHYFLGRPVDPEAFEIGVLEGEILRLEMVKDAAPREVADCDENDVDTDV